MQEYPDEKFEKLIGKAMDSLPEKYMKKLNNVAITYAETPSMEQREKLKLHWNQSLFGLFEGVPQTARGHNYQNLPDKITIFKKPMIFTVENEDQLYKQIRKTLWHEIAHHFGLGHDEIHALE